MSVSQNTNARRNIQNFWLTRLDQEPIEIVAMDYARTNKKGYAHSLNFLRKLMGLYRQTEVTEDSTEGAGSKKPVAFKKGQVGRTISGKSFRVVLTMPEGAVFAAVEGIGVVRFDENQRSSCGERIASVQTDQPEQKTQDKHTESVKLEITDILHLTSDELIRVKEFLGKLRAGSIR